MAKGYESSAYDKRKDKAAAKKRGISVRKFEGSRADRRMDAKAKRKGY